MISYEGWGTGGGLPIRGGGWTGTSSISIWPLLSTNDESPKRGKEPGAIEALEKYQARRSPGTAGAAAREIGGGVGGGGAGKLRSQSRDGSEEERLKARVLNPPLVCFKWVPPSPTVLRTSSPDYGKPKRKR